MKDIELLIRENIKKLKPYSSARDEYKGKEGIFLDANENAFGSAAEELHNRYPDPLQQELKAKVSKLKNVPIDNIFIGNGSDEPIDLLFRCFCNPGTDQCLIHTPTYGMYEVSAHINDVQIINIMLTSDFQLNVDEALSKTTAFTKLMYICSPNNPTGNTFKSDAITKLINNFQGIVVLDEAYIDFCPDKSFLWQLEKYPNLVILQTLSKAWGMANLRVGLAFAHANIIQYLNKIKPPYNLSGSVQKYATAALSYVEKKEKHVTQIILQRKWLEDSLRFLPMVTHIYPSDANFLLVKMTDAQKIYDYLISKSIIVRDRSKVALCDNCLRITVGTGPENKKLIEELEKY
ncbi:MAG: histidinol-phosphate transaminase [Cytophagales bacterium]|nr:histidinol-phosphate transaminase [Cytophagales bacterium]